VNNVFSCRQKPFTAEHAENAEMRIPKPLRLRVLGDLGGEKALGDSLKTFFASVVSFEISCWFRDARDTDQV
jgi:hypothetical protein